VVVEAVDLTHISELPQETLLELTRRMVPAEVRTHLPRIHFGIADTNVILKNIGRDARQRQRPTRMRILAATGAFRLYVGPHVVDEVEEKIDTWMAERGLDSAVARKIWMEEYLPRLWVVQMGHAHLDDSRVAAVAVRDPDDLPTAQLAVLLGRKALSEDKDLAANGLATGEPWLEIVLATSSVAWGETVNFGVGAGISISAQSVAEAIAAVRRVAETPDGQRALLIIGAVLLLIVAGGLVLREMHEPSRRWIDDKVTIAASALASGGRVAITGYVTVSNNRAHGETVLRGGVVAGAREQSLTQSLARELASSEAPVSTRDLAAHVWDYQRVPTAAASRMRELLSSMPAFVEVGSNLWQLGRRSLAR
jgi:predicted nucleic acid-binding protein